MPATTHKIPIDKCLKVLKELTYDLEATVHTNDSFSIDKKTFKVFLKQNKFEALDETYREKSTHYFSNGDYLIYVKDAYWGKFVQVVGTYVGSLPAFVKKLKYFLRKSGIKAKAIPGHTYGTNLKKENLLDCLALFKQFLKENNAVLEERDSPKVLQAVVDGNRVVIVLDADKGTIRFNQFTL